MRDTGSGERHKGCERHRKLRDIRGVRDTGCGERHRKLGEIRGVRDTGSGERHRKLRDTGS